MSITPLTTTFTPSCTGTLSVAGVTNAATAFDWFSPTGTGGTAIASITNSKNKAFAQHTAYEAKYSLMPMVKAELFINRLNSSKTLITSNLNTIITTLQSIQDPSFASQISTLTPTYTSSLTSINNNINSLKSFEARIYNTSDSIDVAANSGTGNISTIYGSTTTLTSFTGVKTYVATFFEPANLAATTIPAITSANGNAGNAATLETIFTNALTALTNTTIISRYKAEYLTASKQIFDAYCIIEQGFAATATSGNYTGTAPVGIFPGIDYLLFTDGTWQSGTAASGTPGAPSATIDFW
jgi:hypothetical protein